MNALTVTCLSGSQHPPKVDSPEGDETKESVSMNADLHTLPKFQVSNFTILLHVMP